MKTQRPGGHSAALRPQPEDVARVIRPAQLTIDRFGGPDDPPHRPLRAGVYPYKKREVVHLNHKVLWLPVLGLALLAGGCAPNMFQQPKYKALAKSDFFADGSAARAPVEGTVARGRLRTDERFFTGKVKGVLVATLPLTVTRGVLERGKERYDIFCSPCHGRVGDGTGMVVQRGLRRPPSYHIDRLREAPDGHFFDVITNGFGAMPSYASRIGAGDRWAITAYIRALQLSQAAKIQDVPPAERPKLLEATK